MKTLLFIAMIACAGCASAPATATPPTEQAQLDSQIENVRAKIRSYRNIDNDDTRDSMTAAAEAEILSLEARKQSSSVQ